MPPVRYKLTLAYDGTGFHGWQKQEPPASSAAAGGGVALEPVSADSDQADGEPRVILRTVQEVVERAVREVVRESVTLTGASRTDAGVHAGSLDREPAGGQVAAFTSEPDPERGIGWPAERGTERLVKALNGRLPDDVLVLSAQIVPLDFEPIGGAVEKAYTYTYHCGPTRPLWDRNFVFQTWHDLDADAMNAAAQRLIGEHDFVAFAQASHGRKTTVRTITACRVERVEGTADRIRLTVSGTGFLYNMVRIIAGTLMEVGRGKMAGEDIDRILASKDRVQAGPTLPPEGLRLEWIRYGESQ